jgi:hypothetical protein
VGVFGQVIADLEGLAGHIDISAEAADQHAVGQALDAIADVPTGPDAVPGDLDALSGEVDGDGIGPGRQPAGHRRRQVGGQARRVLGLETAQAKTRRQDDGQQWARLRRHISDPLPLVTSV